MACDGSSEKDISVVFEKLSITSSDQTPSQTKKDSEYPPPVQSQYCLQYRRLEKVKTVLMLKQLLKKSIKPVAQVLMKAALRSIYLNY